MRGWHGYGDAVPEVDRIVALELCNESIERPRSRRLPNAEAQVGFVERFEPVETSDWIVMSEVLEHLRQPHRIVARALGWLKRRGSTVPA